MDFGERCGRRGRLGEMRAASPGSGTGPKGAPVPPGHGQWEQPGPAREGAATYRAFAHF